MKFYTPLVECIIIDALLIQWPIKLQQSENMANDGSASFATITPFTAVRFRCKRFIPVQRDTLGEAYPSRKQVPVPI